MLKIEDLKEDDWLIGKSVLDNKDIIRYTKTARLYHRSIDIDDFPLPLDQQILEGCNFKYLTIKPEGLKENVVVRCSEEWMAEALCWALDRLGYTWYTGIKYIEQTNWNIFKNDTCYSIHDGCFSSYDFYKNTHKIIPFWDAVTGEEETEGGKMRYEWNVESIKISEIYKDICNEKDKKDFAHLCFKNEVGIGYCVDKEANLCLDLLEEIQKPGKEHWLKYARKEGYIKKIPTYKTVWVNLYLVKEGVVTRNTYDTKEDADIGADKTGALGEYLKTVSLEIPEE